MFNQASTMVDQGDAINQHLLERFQLVDLAKIEDCQKLVEEIRLQQAKFRSLFIYSNEDRRNIAMLFGSRPVTLNDDPANAQNAFDLYQIVQKKKSELDEAACLKWAEESRRDLAVLNIKHAEELVQEKQQRINELEEKVERLKVRERDKFGNLCVKAKTSFSHDHSKLIPHLLF